MGRACYLLKSLKIWFESSSINSHCSSLRDSTAEQGNLSRQAF